MNNSGLSLGDIELIRSSFIDTLKGRYHVRVKYPGNELLEVVPPPIATLPQPEVDLSDPEADLPAPIVEPRENQLTPQEIETEPR